VREVGERRPTLRERPAPRSLVAAGVREGVE
jgi:hypothetical protein